MSLTRNGPSRSNPSRAFTLVELLVVIAIIAILISIVVPTLSRVRESANRIACLANLRQLASAALGYVSENRQRLPEAGSSNASESAYSPRATGLPTWSPLSNAYGTDAYVLPCAASLLQKWCGSNGALWTCPGAAPRRPMVMMGNAFDGTTSADQFRPNYYYMGGKDYVLFLNTSPALAASYRFKDWAIRSVSGLAIGQVRTVADEPSSKIVLFRDYNATYHTRPRRDIYDLPDGQSDKYWSHYAYLDGHAEGMFYKDFAEYIGQMHSPIRQTWWGYEFSATGVAPAP